MFPDTGPSVRVRPRDVSETLLWELYHRAMEARRPDTVLHDPVAVDLLDEIDHPFELRLGEAGQAVAQAVALRAKAFDIVVRGYLAGHPGATVVALGEGLETRFWRVDDGRVRWLCVDAPGVIDLRRRVLPGHERMRLLPGRVQDPAWLEALDPQTRRRGVLVTAQGVLMFLRPHEVRDLVVRCARALPGGQLVFDAVPRRYARRTVRGRARTAEGRRVPPMSFGMDAAERRRLAALHPNIAEVADVPLPPGRGAYFRYVTPHLEHVPLVRDRRPTITVLRFGSGTARG